MPESCIFCGATPTTREHVFRQSWLKPLLPADTYTHELRRRTGADEKPLETWIKVAPEGAVLKAVCGQCNGGWMADLARRAEPALTPMCLAQPRTLWPSDIAAVAAWSVQVALVLDAGHSPMNLKQDVRSLFYENRKPLPEMRIWLAAMDNFGAEARQISSSLTERIESASDPQGYVATFRALHLVIQVLIPESGVRVARHSAFEKFVTPLWPDQRVVIWPPSAVLSGEAEFDLLGFQFGVLRD